MQNWLKQVPAVDTFNLLDLFQIEQHNGCWAGIWPYAECDAGFPIFPLCHRRVIERMLTLPVAYRRSGSLMKDIIAREWPELLELPINRPVGMLRLSLAINKTLSRILKASRNIHVRIVKALRDPSWAISRTVDRIRQLFANRNI